MTTAYNFCLTYQFFGSYCRFCQNLTLEILQQDFIFILQVIFLSILLFFLHSCFYLKLFVALNGLLCADVPLALSKSCLPADFLLEIVDEHCVILVDMCV